jgi:hypothetical protein
MSERFEIRVFPWGEANPAVETCPGTACALSTEAELMPMSTGYGIGCTYEGTNSWQCAEKSCAAATFWSIEDCEGECLSGQPCVPCPTEGTEFCAARVPNSQCVPLDTVGTEHCGQGLSVIDPPSIACDTDSECSRQVCINGTCDRSDGATGYCQACPTPDPTPPWAPTIVCPLTGAIDVYYTCSYPTSLQLGLEASMLYDGGSETTRYEYYQKRDCPEGAQCKNERCGDTEVECLASDSAPVGTCDSSSPLVSKSGTLVKIAESSSGDSIFASSDVVMPGCSGCAPLDWASGVLYDVYARGVNDVGGGYLGTPTCGYGGGVPPVPSAPPTKEDETTRLIITIIVVILGILLLALLIYGIWKNTKKTKRA